jgi:DNA repair protein RecO (recombination protein O)
MHDTTRVELQPAYVLHRYPYRESSLILEVLTADFGRVGIVAKGAKRSRSPLPALLQPFHALLLSWSGRGELYTLVGAESCGDAYRFRGIALASGFYINELLLRLLARHDPHAGLYYHYAQTLQTMREAHRVPIALRLFEKDLLQAIGYALQFDTIDGQPLIPEEVYFYQLEYGASPESAHALRPEDSLRVHGSTLLALQRGKLEDVQTLREARRLLQAALAKHLGGRPLRSRELLIHEPKN